MRPVDAGARRGERPGAYGPRACARRGGGAEGAGVEWSKQWRRDSYSGVRLGFWGWSSILGVCVRSGTRVGGCGRVRRCCRRARGCECRRPARPSGCGGGGLGELGASSPRVGAQGRLAARPCTTAYGGFAESHRLSAKAILLSAKPLPRGTLGKALSAHLLSAKWSLPRVIHRALGKEFAERQTELSAKKSSRYGCWRLTATLPRAT